MSRSFPHYQLKLQCFNIDFINDNIGYSFPIGLDFNNVW